MTKDMPLDGKSSLDMMYRTCGTQLNIDYNSEEDFIKKFQIVNSIIVPISIALFANSSIVEKKIVTIYLTGQKFGRILLVVDYQNYFLID